MGAEISTPTNVEWPDTSKQGGPLGAHVHDFGPAATGADYDKKNRVHADDSGGRLSPDQAEQLQGGFYSGEAAAHPLGATSPRRNSSSIYGDGSKKENMKIGGVAAAKQEKSYTGGGHDMKNTTTTTTPRKRRPLAAIQSPSKMTSALASTVAPSSTTRRSPPPKLGSGSSTTTLSHSGGPRRLVQQARLVTVGARVHSNRHFHTWLDASVEDVGRAREPGVHYTSLAKRVDPTTPSFTENKGRGAMWSEGNRFIVDADL